MTVQNKPQADRTAFASHEYKHTRAYIIGDDTGGSGSTGERSPRNM